MVECKWKKRKQNKQGDKNKENKIKSGVEGKTVYN